MDGKFMYTWWRVTSVVDVLVAVCEVDVAEVVDVPVAVVPVVTVRVVVETVVVVLVVGNMVGDTVGTTDGAAVGVIVGDAVGASVGIAVGEAVHAPDVSILEAGWAAQRHAWQYDWNVTPVSKLHTWNLVSTMGLQRAQPAELGPPDEQLRMGELDPGLGAVAGAGVTRSGRAVVVWSHATC